LNAAVSAGIQKLEEGLSASIENEDESSMETLTEKHGLDHESETSDHQLVDGERSTNQDTKKDISRVDESAAAHSITSDLRTSEDQSEDRTVTTFDLDHENETKRVETNEDCMYLEPENATVEKIEGFKIQDTGSGSLRNASSVQRDQDIISSVYSDEISKTIDTSDVFGSLDTQDTTGIVDTTKEETSEIIKSVGISNTSRTVDTTDPNGTVDTSGMTRSLDTSDTNKTVDTSDPSGTVDTTGLSGTGDTNDPSRTLDTSNLSGTVDTSDPSRKVPVHRSDPSRTVDTSDPSGKEDTTD